MRKGKALSQLRERLQQAVSDLDVAQKRAAALNAVEQPGTYEDQALFSLHYALSQLDYTHHALDVAEFDKLFDAEISHVLDDHPMGLPWSLAVQQVGDILISRGYSFRIGS